MMRNYWDEIRSKGNINVFAFQTAFKGRAGTRGELWSWKRNSSMGTATFPQAVSIRSLQSPSSSTSTYACMLYTLEKHARPKQGEHLLGLHNVPRDVFNYSHCLWKILVGNLKQKAAGESEAVTLNQANPAVFKGFCSVTLTKICYLKCV